MEHRSFYFALQGKSSPAKQEFIYGIFETEPIGPNCPSKAKFMGHTYHITGNVAVDLSKLSYSVDVANIDQGLQVDIDTGSCGNVIRAACFIAGSAIPLLPFPIGGVAAAILCGEELDKKVAELKQRIENASLDKIRNFQFRSTH